MPSERRASNDDPASAPGTARPATEPHDELENPLQFSLRTLFIITTITAIWLSFLKISPVYGVVLGVLIVTLFSPVVVSLWLIRRGERRTGVGCITSMLLVVFPFMIGTSFQAAPPPLLAGSLCLLMAIGILTLPIWLFMFITFMAAREERMQEKEDARKRQDDPE